MFRKTAKSRQSDLSFDTSRYEPFIENQGLSILDLIRQRHETDDDFSFDTSRYEPFIEKPAAISGKVLTGIIVAGFLLLFCLLQGCSSTEPSDSVAPSETPTNAGVIEDVQVRLSDSEDRSWRDELTVHDGDRIDIQAQYINYTEQEHRDVCIAFTLPNGVTLIPKTTYLWNTNHPDGARCKVETVTTTGINIGTYAGTANPADKKENAFVRITCEVHLTDPSITELPIIVVAAGTDSAGHSVVASNSITLSAETTADN